MASIINVLLIIIGSEIVSSYHIECNYDEQRHFLSIVGIKSSQDFEDYGLKCGDYEARTLEYVDCYLGKLRLPLKKLQLNYPNLREIYWRCDGQCIKEGSGIDVFGCDSGKTLRSHICLS